MRTLPPRSALAPCRRHWLEGLRAHWQHGVVVVLVVAGMLSTPLALGSIRNRVYSTVKTQIEKENSACEISLQPASEGAPPLDRNRVAEIERRFPGLEVVGNHKLQVSVEGPEGADALTFQTLEPRDPRSLPLQISPPIPHDFGLTDLVVSDTLGALLYGPAWETLWSSESGEFSGPPLSVRINDLSLAAKFRVVARRRLPGRGLYGSQEAGAVLRCFSHGLGAPALGLPPGSGLSTASGPGFGTTRRGVLLPERDAACGEHQASPAPFDEVLAYVESAEQVEGTSRELRALFPGYEVRYNVLALEKLGRQDARLTTLFRLTLVPSTVFLVLVLAVLARLDLERRRRRLAQMLILGFSRRLVRRLVVAEHLLLTVLASATAYGLTAALCRVARALLEGSSGDASGRDFQMIVDSMSVDPRAFLVVFAIVAACTWGIAILTAHRVAKSGPPSPPRSRGGASYYRGGTMRR